MHQSSRSSHGSAPKSTTSTKVSITFSCAVLSYFMDEEWTDRLYTLVSGMLSPQQQQEQLSTSPAPPAPAPPVHRPSGTSAAASDSILTLALKLEDTTVDILEFHGASDATGPVSADADEGPRAGESCHGVIDISKADIDISVQGSRKVASADYVQTTSLHIRAQGARLLMIDQCVPFDDIHEALFTTVSALGITGPCVTLDCLWCTCVCVAGAGVRCPTLLSLPYPFVCLSSVLRSSLTFHCASARCT